MHVRSSRRHAALVRTLTVAALAGAIALVPGAALAHGGPHGKPVGPPSHVNRAPDAPADPRTSSPDSVCSFPAAVVLRSTTPTLRATLTDPDGCLVSGTFEVRAGNGKKLWSSGPTGARWSGAQHAVVVPEGVLKHGGTYEWRVEARDAANRKSKAVRCAITIDTVAPGPVTVTPVEGAGAVYAEGSTAGGIGVAGDFRFVADDAVAFLYGFGGVPTERVDAVDGAATITWRPTTDGSQALVVEAVDAAGNVGPSTLHRFTVASANAAPTGNARWSFDEGAGSVAPDALAPGGPADLRLSPSVTWTGGLRSDLLGETADLALLLDEAADTAETAGPLLDTARSWAVAAVVRPDAADLTATVVSQGDAFRLGTTTTGCADDAPACWSFTVAGDEPTTLTGGEVQPGSWYVVVGSRDAGSESLRLDVCALGTAEEPGSAAPASTTTGHVGGVAASGAFRVGAVPGEATAWTGAVGGLQTWGGAVDITRVRIICSRGI